MNRGARQELLAAGITDPEVQVGYQLARTLNAEHGKTYYLATLLLPREKRPYVHALYGFARYADNIVDEVDYSDERDVRFGAWTDTFLADLDRGTSADPLRRAVLDTIARWQLPPELFVDFLTSMRMDLVVTDYPTYKDLAEYMWGSAAVIGLQMLPLLGRSDPSGSEEQLRQPAIDLGMAFQLTNFLRDIAEDLDRGRVYLPRETLDRFGVQRADLLHARRTGTASAPIREVIAFEVARARALYQSAEPGIAMVHRTSQDCLRTAWTLYGGILDEIEHADYNVFRARVSVGAGRRARVAAGGLAHAWWTRRFS